MSADPTYPNRYYRAMPYLAGAGVVGLLLCFPGYASSSTVGVVVPILLATLAWVSLAGCWGAGWVLERSLRHFREGRRLGRWDVEGAQWLDFARAQRRKLTARVRWAVGGIAGAAVLILAFEYEEPMHLWLAATVFGGAALFVLVLNRFLLQRPYAPGIHRALIEIGPGVALINGHALTFAGLGQRLTGVEIDDEQQLLILRGYSQNHESSMPFEHELPYPAEAKREVVKAVIALGYGHGLSPVEDE